MKKWTRSVGVCVLLIGVGRLEVVAQQLTLSLNPTEDTFTRKAVPNSTLGAAGALHVSGEEAANGAGQAMGVADAWMKFDLAPAVIEFDARLGGGLWGVASVTLTLDEVAAPRNAIFTRGVGEFEVFWVTRDGWSEGVGRPQGQGTAVADMMSYAFGEGIREASLDESLGVFANNGADGPVELDLDVTDGLAADIAAGGSVTLLLTAVDPGIGFTFHSRTWQGPDQRPLLSVVARTIVEDEPDAMDMDEEPMDEPDVVDEPVDDGDQDTTVGDEGDMDDGTTDMVDTDMDQDTGADMDGGSRSTMCGAGLLGPAMFVLGLLTMLRIQRIHLVSRRR